MDELTDAIEAAAAGGFAPPPVWQVDPDAEVYFAAGRNPFDGATFTHWSRD